MPWENQSHKLQKDAQIDKNEIVTGIFSAEATATLSTIHPQNTIDKILGNYLYFK